MMTKLTREEWILFLFEFVNQGASYHPSLTMTYEEADGLLTALMKGGKDLTPPSDLKEAL